MTTNVIRYKVAKAMYKIDNSELVNRMRESEFAENFRNWVETHEKLYLGICGTLVAIEFLLVAFLIVGTIIS